VLLLLLSVGSATAEVEVGEVLWGFDGKVVPQRINLLSIRLVNRGSEAVEGPAVVFKARGLGGRLGAQLVQQCYLAPGTTRWVQFHPYVGSAHDEWRLSIGDREEELRDPTLSAPATVWLDPGDMGGQCGLKAFPENLFPTTVAATDGLCSVVLDHRPQRWQLARKTAFLDWLRRGGTLHLLSGDAGRPPIFSHDLSVLNTAGPRFRVGAGLVVRHQESRREMTLDLLAQRGFAPLKLAEKSGSFRTFKDSIFEGLKGLVRPRHNWAAMYLALAVFMILAGPVNYLVGKKTRDFRITGVFFLVAVGGFALLLGYVGRRGHGEIPSAHTLSYARSLGGDTYDVTQWINAFAVRGARYAITHPATHNLYSTCQEAESVRGTILTGKAGFFEVDIPVCSSRAFLHRGKMKGHDMDLRVVEWPGEGGKLVLAIGPGFPETVIEMWALYGGGFHRLRLQEGRLETSGGRGSEREGFLRAARERAQDIYDHGGGPWQSEDNRRPEEVFRAMIRPLMAQCLGGADSPPFVPTDPLSGDRVELFIFAPAPESFRLTAKGLGSELGYVLYHVDVFRPEKPYGSDS